VRHNVRVGVQYIAAWLSGSGCVPLYNLMEDAATAEICRAQLWQWLRHGARLSNRKTLTQEFFESTLREEMHAIERAVGTEVYAANPYDPAAHLFRRLVTNSSFEEFLTLPAYDLLP
jgi:malate synthase